MNENEDQLPEDEDRELEEQLHEAVRKLIPAVRIARNVTRALSRLTSVGAETAAAALEARGSRFRLQTARNEYLINLLAKLEKGDSRLAVRVAARLLDEQHRVDQVVFDAVRRVLEAAPSAAAEEGTEQISDSWFNSFRREAGDRTEQEMRERFARILAGEIRCPGTFSLKTLRTVGTLSQSTAALFRRAASLHFGQLGIVPTEGGALRFQVVDARIPAIGGHLGENSLRREGMDYFALVELMENDLLHTDLNSWRIYNASIATPQAGTTVVLPFLHQGRQWTLVPLPTFRLNFQLKVHGAAFTGVGKELLRIVDLETDAKFLDKVRAHLNRNHVDMVIRSSDRTHATSG